MFSLSGGLTDARMKIMAFAEKPIRRTITDVMTIFRIYLCFSEIYQTKTSTPDRTIIFIIAESEIIHIPDRSNATQERKATLFLPEELRIALMLRTKKRISRMTRKIRPLLTGRPTELTKNLSRESATLITPGIIPKRTSPRIMNEITVE